MSHSASAYKLAQLSPAPTYGHCNHIHKMGRRSRRINKTTTDTDSDQEVTITTKRKSKSSKENDIEQMRLALEEQRIKLEQQKQQQDKIQQELAVLNSTTHPKELNLQESTLADDYIRFRTIAKSQLALIPSCTDAIKVNFLLDWMGYDCREAYNNANQPLEVAPFWQFWDKQCLMHEKSGRALNATRMEMRFKLKQQRGESCKSYYLRIHALSAQCGYKDAKLREIHEIDTFLYGLYYEKARDRCYNLPADETTLQKYIEVAHSVEMMAQQRHETNIMLTETKRPYQMTQPPTTENTAHVFAVQDKPLAPRRPCRLCGKRHGFRECTYDCPVCARKGHSEAECWANPKSPSYRPEFAECIKNSQDAQDGSTKKIDVADEKPAPTYTVTTYPVPPED